MPRLDNSGIIKDMKSLYLVFKLLSVGFYALLLTMPVAAIAEEMLWAIPKPDESNALSRSLVKPSLREIPSSVTPIDPITNAATPFIVGGNNASRGEYSEYGRLLVDGLDGYLYFLCGSTLISGNKVLTAAHCTIDYSASRLYVIPNYYSTSDSVSSSQIYRATVKYIHPNYGTSPPKNDISILSLVRSANTAQAKIYGGSNQFVNVTSTVVGMGLLYDDGLNSTILQEVNLPIISNATCANYWGSSNITSNMLCAGYQSGNPSACNGDSGGPLFLQIQGQKVQAGIVSWGSNTCSGYNVYARTSGLISFVRQNAPSATIVTDPPPLSSDVAFLPAIYSLLLLD